MSQSTSTPGESTALPTSYIPTTDVRYAWDSTALGAYKTCPRYYKLSIIDGWTPKNQNVHLRFGIEMHLALQDYEIFRAKGAKFDEALHHTVQNLVERTDEWEVDTSTPHGRYKNKATIRQLVVDYLDHYRDDPAKTVIKADGTPAVELSFQFGINHYTTYQGTAYGYVLCGHLDKLVHFNDQLFVKDVKTSMKTLGDAYFRQFEPNNQMTFYTTAGKIVLNTEVRGVIIDAAQILLREPNRFVRGITYRSEDQMNEWLEDLYNTLHTAELHALEGIWPQNDMACRFCRFREACATAPHARERFLRADFDQLAPEERWNPLKAR